MSDDQVAVVTGVGAGSLGEATAAALRELGFRVLTTTRTCPIDEDTHPLELTTRESVADFAALGQDDHRPARRPGQQRRRPPRPALGVARAAAGRRAEVHWRTNYLGTAQLTRLLLPLLLATADGRRGPGRQRGLQAARARPQRGARRPPHAVRLLGGVRHLQAGAGARGARDRAAVRRPRAARLLAAPRRGEHQHRRPRPRDRAGPRQAAQAGRAARAPGAQDSRRTAPGRWSSARPRRRPSRVATTARGAEHARRRTHRTRRPAGSCGRPPTAGATGLNLRRPPAARVWRPTGNSGNSGRVPVPDPSPTSTTGRTR